ncbi:MAG: hypothetical protein K2W96_11390, partial [Gemmataceae bacterium]|nr:hypothetical protein [Gemmataceae bacterium]
MVVAFYRLGLRVRQTERLHGVAVRRRDPDSLDRVTRALNLLGLGAEEALRLLGPGSHDSRLRWLLDEADREWRFWAKGRGQGEDPTPLLGMLRDAEAATIELARAASRPGQPAECWFDLGKLMAGIGIVPRRGCHGEDSSEIAFPDDPRFVYSWKEQPALHRLLEATAMGLDLLVPPHRDMRERLQITGVPEDFLGWHDVEAGLCRLVEAADRERPFDPDIEERDPWIYEQRKMGKRLKLYFPQNSESKVVFAARSA